MGGGKYRLETFLGRGGVGEVYRAKQVDLDRDVAIKVLTDEVLDRPNAQERFRREALSASQLRHTNTVQILDFGVEDAESFIVMEFLDGYHLGRYIRRDGRFKLEELVAVGSQICAALAAAHDRHIVHRDIKPQNIILVARRDDRGRPYHLVKVCDFGFAKFVAQAPTRPRADTLTNAGEVLGTPRYMSPEQAQGKKLDPRSDIYALGVLLFEMATGQVPFDGKTHHLIMMQHALHAPPRPSELNPRVTPELEAIILKAMAKKRSDRFASMRELRRALLGLIDVTEPPRVHLKLHHDFDQNLPDLTTSGGSDFTAALSSITTTSQPLSGLEPGVDANQRLKVMGIVASALALLLGLGLGYLLFAGSGEPAPESLDTSTPEPTPRRLLISSHPEGARIQVNGNPVEQTTPMLIELAGDEREAEVLISLYGRKPWLKRVALKEGAITRRHVVLETSERAFLRVTCETCDVRVNGDRVDRAGASIVPVQAGVALSIAVGRGGTNVHTLGAGEVLDVPVEGN